MLDREQRNASPGSLLTSSKGNGSKFLNKARFIPAVPTDVSLDSNAMLASEESKTTKNPLLGSVNESREQSSRGGAITLDKLKEKRWRRKIVNKRKSLEN